MVPVGGAVDVVVVVDVLVVLVVGRGDDDSDIEPLLVTDEVGELALAELEFEDVD